MRLELYTGGEVRLELYPGGKVRLELQNGVRWGSMARTRCLKFLKVIARYFSSPRGGTLFSS